MKEITVPDIGDFHDVEVIEVLVKPGDRVELETPLVTLETEKATMDVPSSGAGVVKAVSMRKGDRVNKGTLILQLEEGTAADTPASPSSEQPKAAAAAPSQPAPEAKPPSKAPSAPLASDPAHVPAAEEVLEDPGHSVGVAPPPVNSAATTSRGSPPATDNKSAASRSALPPIDEPGFARAYASPSVRKFARELGVDLARIKGSGPKGRITHDDVKVWVKQALSAGVTSAAGGVQTSALPQFTAADFAKFGPVESQPLGRVQKISGPRLHASWVTVPHVWQMDEADITELEDVRTKLKGKAAKEGIKLTPLAFILRACVKALQEFPNFNASLESGGQNLILKKYMHLGFAADTPLGLMVPVIRDADRKDIYELARELAALSEKARDRKLSAAEMQGACFTVSSLGGIGGTSFTPIINAPEVAILGVARSSMKPVYENGSFVPKLMLPFTLAYDHRVIDGAQAVRFTTYLAERLHDVRSLLEAVP
jgi:pyruvate dehydrogenase E2 component (dihydrolipoamide acetyltransferase)